MIIMIMIMIMIMIIIIIIIFFFCPEVLHSPRDLEIVIIM